MNLFRYGPNKSFVRAAVRLSWPLMTWARKLSDTPGFRWIINPFFAYPHNELTTIPINVAIPAPDSVVVPRRIVAEVVRRAGEIFILDECICRGKFDCKNHPKTIGCIALGKAARRIHPSHGHTATTEEAVAHVEKAAAAGLVANIAHVWIDPVAFGLPDFRRLMFICFCDDCCCLYRTHMKRRGPNLERASKKLPGLETVIDADLCDGCGRCVPACFVGAITIENGKAVIGASCKSCGRCADLCPTGAARLVVTESEADIFQQVMERIEKVADIS